MTEAASLYEKMVKDFTNETMIIAAAGCSTKLLPSTIYSVEQTGHERISL